MKRKTILLVDDDADDRSLFCEAWQLAAPEIICSTARNGRHALSMLEKKEIELPAIIFLDVNMPIINGWQLLALLKKDLSYKMIPVVMYSTSSSQEDINKAHQLGAFCFFTKPHDFRVLEKCLEAVAENLHNDSLSNLTNIPEFFVAPHEEA